MTKKEVEEAGIKQLFSKALVKNADWQDKDDLLDVLYWGRQGLSLILGIIWGILPITGIIGIGLYLAISTFAGHYYITNYQSVSILYSLGRFYCNFMIV